MTNKHQWHDNRLMRGEQELARIEAHGEYWRVYYRGATSKPTTRAIAAKLAELATRHD
jgi:hypothetical protein